MSEGKSMMATKLAAAQANAKILEQFVPQLFSNPKILTGGASDSGSQDEWMLSNMPSEVLIPLAGLQLIAEADKRLEINDFVHTILRGLKGVGGFQVKMGETIAVGLGGSGQGRKVIRRPGVIGRNVTNRGWEKRASEQNAEIEE